MSRDIKVSVLTPIYNHKIEYVRECLESLRAQTMQDIEFILIDNGATDESKALISEFEQSDSRFRVIHLKENQGYGGAMNAGLDVARGEYIGIVESDDKAEPNMYEKLYSVAEKYPKVDIIKGNLYLFGNNYKNRAPYIQDEFTERVIDLKDFPQFAFKCAWIWTNLYKKSLVKQFGFVAEKGIYFQDLIFQLQTWQFAKKIYICRNYVYNYRTDNENSSVNQGEDTAFKNLATIEWIFKYFSENPKSDYYTKQVVSKRLFFLITYNLGKIKRPVNKIKYLQKAARMFEGMLSEKLITLKLFNQEDINKINKIAKHPILYALFHHKKHKTVYINKKKYLAGLITKKYTPDKKKVYICGIQVFTKNLNNSSSQSKNFDYNRLRKEMQEEIVFNNLVLRDHAKFLQYKNIYQDRDVVIVARGPSAAKYTNPIEGAIHIALNKAFKNPDIKFDYIFMHDYSAIKDYILDSKDYPCTKFFGRCLYLHFKTHVIPNFIVDKCNANLYYTNAPFETIFSDIDCAPLMDFMSVAFPAIHFALYTGAKRIFLVGCDCSSDGYSDGTKQSTLSLANINQHHQKMFKGYKLVKEFAERNYPETEIISINPVNLKGYFKDIYTDENNMLHLDEKVNEEVLCVN